MKLKKNTSAPPRSALIQLPSARALLVQTLAFAVAAAADRLILQPIWGDTSPYVFMLLQGGAAVLFAYAAGLALWWLPIQFFFPVLMVLMQGLHLPSWLYLAAFLICLALYWTTFRTQVPFFPTTRSTWNAVLSLLPKGRGIRFVDLGSGLGGLVLHVAEGRQDSESIGVEIAPLPWAISAVRGFFGKGRVRFVRADYDVLDLAQFDVVFAYLSPAAMPSLWEKACAEMRPGSLFLSYEFIVPGREPSIVSLPDANGASLYGWSM